jgi:hypothetical protein
MMGQAEGRGGGRGRRGEGFHKLREPVGREGEEGRVVGRVEGAVHGQGGQQPGVGERRGGGLCASVHMKKFRFKS